MRNHELILGGQRSGKSRCAEGRAAAGLAGQVAGLEVRLKRPATLSES